MPELPEVEIASRQLRSWLEGRRIVSARAEKSRIIRGQTQARFGGLVGRRLAGIDVDRLHAVLSRTRRSMKEALMDQRTLAGLGNIQVSESLHRAGIDPRRPARSMTREETERLAEAIGASLRATLTDEDSPE